MPKYRIHSCPALVETQTSTRYCCYGTVQLVLSQFKNFLSSQLRIEYGL